MEALLGRVIDEADAGQLPVLIDEWLAADDVRRWIALALKLDLPVLVRRPDIAVPCVLRRCTWLGARAPFHTATGETTREAAAVRELVATWRAAWPHPHLAARRPPHVPLDAGVVEEYRTAAEGPLWITADAIGVGTAIAWERASGRRIAAAPPPPGPVWTLDRRAAAGEALVDAAGKHVRIALADAGEEASRVYGLDAELGIVVSATEVAYEDEHATYLVERATGRIVWRVRGNCVGAVRVRDRIYTRGHQDIAIHDVATGEFLVEHEVTCTDLAACDDGLFATRFEHVIRVWDWGRMGSQIAQLASNFRFVQLSPDETRVVTGYLLCDAHTGTVISTLDLHTRGGWLEAGSRDSRRLCNGVFVEVNPFGTAVWDTTTGELVVEDRRREADVRDSVAFDPLGRTHAIWSHRTTELRVLGVRDGREVLSRRIALGDGFRRTQLGYTGDGDHLWWIARDDTRWICELASGAVRPLLEPVPIEAEREAAVIDGVLVAGDLAIPIDATSAIASRDGSVFAAWNAHYVRSG
jgi:hypothetical protein